MTSLNQLSPFVFDSARRQPVYRGPVADGERTPHLTGLCSGVLRRKFFSKYRFKRSMLVGGDAGAGKVTYGGRKRGTAIDMELYECIERRNRARAETISPMGNKIMSFLKRHNYNPHASQVGVGIHLRDRRWLYTAVDIVCRQSAHEVVLVEVKCKETPYYEKSTGTMHAPFSLLTDSQRNQDQLQLAFTKAMYQATFPTDSVVGAIVLRAHTHGIHVYPLQRSVDSHVPEALRVLRSSTDDELKSDATRRPRRASAKSRSPTSQGKKPGSSTMRRTKKRVANAAATSNGAARHTKTPPTTKKKTPPKKNTPRSGAAHGS